MEQNVRFTRTTYTDRLTVNRYFNKIIHFSETRELETRKKYILPKGKNRSPVPMSCERPTLLSKRRLFDHLAV